MHVGVSKVALRNRAFSSRNVVLSLGLGLKTEDESLSKREEKRPVEHPFLRQGFKPTARKARKQIKSCRNYESRNFEIGQFVSNAFSYCLAISSPSFG